MLLHMIVQMKSDRSPRVKNEKTALDRDVQTPLNFSHLANRCAQCVCVCVCVCARARLSVANIVRSTPILMSENCGPRGFHTL